MVSWLAWRKAILHETPQLALGIKHVHCDDVSWNYVEGSLSLFYAYFRTPCVSSTNAHCFQRNISIFFWSLAPSAKAAISLSVACFLSSTCSSKTALLRTPLPVKHGMCQVGLLIHKINNTLCFSIFLPFFIPFSFYFELERAAFFI